MRLFNFSQSSPEGYRLSRSIVDKMLKGATDGNYKAKPSAYLTKNVNNAWREVNPDGEKYAGQKAQRWGHY